MRWTFVILTWNGREDTLRCLAALRRVHGDHRVVVADNASTDGSVTAIRAAFPDVTVLAAATNLGYSGGNNLAIRRALTDGADWVVLVNNDAELAPDALDALNAAARRWPRAGILAGKLLFPEPDGRVQWAGQRVGLLTGYSGRPRGWQRPDGPRYAVEEPVDRAVGALMAVSREAVDAAGLLDEELFAYVEDVDWSLRIRAKGFQCVLAPTARARHRLSGSGGGANVSVAPLYYGPRNTIVVFERHRPLGAMATRLRRVSILVTFAARAAVAVRTRLALQAVCDGWRDGCAGRLGLRPTVQAKENPRAWASLTRSRRRRN
jgi:GT2 family glycosyltransferase